ncbi:MAG: CPBP family intramembrane metalloprotease [Rhabdochlamydiaceae bacterium]|nr:CPBP family intramembrane metalloprotease [Candidatus Amphrikana amoebophyrae]
MIKKALIYTFTFSIAWVVGNFFLFQSGKLPMNIARYYVSAFFFITMWIPGIVGLILAKKDNIKLKFIGNTPFYLFLALAVPFVITVAILGMNMLFSPMKMTPQLAHSITSFISLPITGQILSLGSATLAVIVVIFTINALFSLGEEILWRGYLLEKLKEFSFWKQSLVIGIAWGAWHAPLILLFQYNYPTAPYIGSAMMILLCILMSPIMIHLKQKSGNLYVPAVFHGAINGISGLSILIFRGSNSLLTGITGASGIIVLILLNIILYIQHRKQPVTITHNAVDNP